ncbi:hypothetical protein A2230_00225 [candidate division WOR-1 bacterium RIFOXYA2_FULL_36_21]|uniref:Uncharacterized protein n=1 Tax=candidate division WOR-1 bacterium RIFOXYB2_FULL_36_35 TaxID=1802578 RepID=A0A1F4RZZ3_UNCSA|nr:MAG: hypothetical protein A2230_00225 [candidate division WOR-1 bacterium RIFOXYA2_FULL_36_21]OGC13742.1 MAG: hypothetical protein A2290_07705 [candidate division WOR-1 bacterium RIFOXYB2_FULL_36_35]
MIICVKLFYYWSDKKHMKIQGIMRVVTRNYGEREISIIFSREIGRLNRARKSGSLHLYAPNIRDIAYNSVTNILLNAKRVFIFLSSKLDDYSVVKEQLPELDLHVKQILSSISENFVDKNSKTQDVREIEDILMCYLKARKLVSTSSVSLEGDYQFLVVFVYKRLLERSSVDQIENILKVVESKVPRRKTGQTAEFAYAFLAFLSELTYASTMDDSRLFTPIRKSGFMPEKKAGGFSSSDFPVNNLVFLAGSSKGKLLSVDVDIADFNYAVISLTFIFCFFVKHLKGFQVRLESALDVLLEENPTKKIREKLETLCPEQLSRLYRSLIQYMKVSDIRFKISQGNLTFKRREEIEIAVLEIKNDKLTSQEAEFLDDSSAVKYFSPEEIFVLHKKMGLLIGLKTRSILPLFV